jgi:hypothetical protein
MLSLVVFNRVYRLEIQSVMVVFSTQLCELLSLYSYLWLASSPLPCMNKCTVYTYTVCKGGKYVVIGGEGAPDR